MRLCAVSPYRPGIDIGGAENYLTTLAAMTIPSLDELHLLVPDAALNSRLGGAPVIVHRLEAFGDSDPYRSQRIFEALDRLIPERGVEILESHHFRIGSKVPILRAVGMAAVRHRIALFLRLHGTVHGDDAGGLLEGGLPSRTKVLCLNRQQARRLETLGVDPTRLAVIPPPIDTDRFRPRSVDLRRAMGYEAEDVVLLHASRVTRDRPGCEVQQALDRKGVLTLLEAFVTLAPRHPRLRLLIAAGQPGPEYRGCFQLAVDWVRDYSRRHGVDSRVRIKAFPYDQMDQVHNVADVFVMASREEASSLSYCEAMACAKPVVATAVGGTPELIRHRWNGYLVRPGDPAALAERISDLAEDRLRRLQFGRRGRDWASAHLSLPMVAAELGRSYREAVCGLAGLTAPEAVGRSEGVR